MDAHRFDRLAKALSGRLSRRGALAAGGGGLAAAMLAARSPGTAQDATPAASPGASPDATPATADAELLFVQVFAAGTWTPAPDEAGAYTLTLTGHAAQTVYFSDRPARLVGTIPTRRFLDQLGFTPEDPPNAAVVAQTAGGGEDVLVVELFDPVYAESFGGDGDVRVTYRARVLAGYEGEGLAALAARQGDGTLPESFGPASLFIDAPTRGCDDRPINCKRLGYVQGQFGPMGFCWEWGQFCCKPCSGSLREWTERCNATFASCSNNCKAEVGGGLFCW